MALFVLVSISKRGAPKTCTRSAYFVLVALAKKGALVQREHQKCGLLALMMKICTQFALIRDLNCSKHLLKSFFESIKLHSFCTHIFMMKLCTLFALCTHSGSNQGYILFLSALALRSFKHFF